MALADDHIVLISNTKTFALENSISKFRTRLARRRVFPPTEDWRVAVTDITYNQSWYNVLERTQIKFMYLDGRELSDPLTLELRDKLFIEPGHYESVDQLIFTINERLLYLVDYFENIPKIFYNNVSHIVQIEPGKVKTLMPNQSLKHGELLFVPILGRELESLLGLVDYQERTIEDRVLQNTANEIVIASDIQKCLERYPTERIEGNFPADVNAGFNNLYVYSDIVQASDVGDAHAPLLCCVPNKHSKEGWGGSVHHEPKNLIYRPLQLRSFDTIEIDVRDDSGQSIPFKSGVFIIKLHIVRNG